MCLRDSQNDTLALQEVMSNDCVPTSSVFRPYDTPVKSALRNLDPSKIVRIQVYLGHSKGEENCVAFRPGDVVVNRNAWTAVVYTMLKGLVWP